MAFVLFSCVDPNDDGPSTSQPPSGYQFKEILDSEKNYTIESNETLAITLNVDIKKANYLKMEISTEVPLVGYIMMRKTSDEEATAQDLFFIPKDNSEPFKQILDVFDYLEGANKTITEITFKNVSSESGNFTVTSIGITTRNIPLDYDEKQLYIKDGGLELGVHLANGGAINSLKKDGVVQVKDNATGIVSVGLNYDKLEGKTVMYRSVRGRSL